MTKDLRLELHEGSALWARVFPHVYEPFLWLGEWAGVRALRKHVVHRSRGRTVEIGAGTGLNLPHYPGDIDELVLAEPDSGMHARLQRRVSRSGRSARIVDAPAERLPFGRGCRCNRPMAELIAASGLILDGTRRASWRLMPPIVRPLVAGRAQLAASHG